MILEIIWTVITSDVIVDSRHLGLSDLGMMFFGK